MSTAKIFAYKGNVGIDIDTAGKFLNNPKANGQLGCVISTSEIDISQEAKEIITKARRGGGSFSELMLTVHHQSVRASQGKSSIGVLGWGKVHLGSSFEIGRTCDIKALDDCNLVQMEAPPEYKAFIDSL